MQNPENSTLTVNPQCSYKEEDTLPRSRSRCTTLSRASSQTNLTSVSADASRFKRHSSRHSSTTSLSSASAIATKARAKAEAACAMASYAKQEAELMKEQAKSESGALRRKAELMKEQAKSESEALRRKAELMKEQAKSESEALRRKAEVQASLHLLQQQKNAAAALAEAEVLTRAAEAQFADIETQMSPLSASQRTREYIQSQATMYTDQQFNYAPRPSLTPPAISNFDTMQHCKTESEPQGRKSSGHILRDQSANLTRVQTDADLLPPQANTSLDYSRKTYNRGEQSRLSQVPHQPYQPQPYPEFTPRKYSPDAAKATEVARFLMRREINGRTSCLCPCTNSLHIKERLVNPTHHRSIQRYMEDLASTGDTDELGGLVYQAMETSSKSCGHFLEEVETGIPGDLPAMQEMAR
ncbi:uncharacterized protein LOC130352034 [Hyla sarda]|uniref:uncharacterized protein LOC130352034 n=1 Tax=Hyla sarda TaxID=327740 RepID=UPI0024C2D953|nr:uncharacterized protein LOC130352034 [Hyla sarda]